MTKYQKYFQQMLERNEQLFREFKTIHDHYVTDPSKWQEEFNARGEKVLAVLREWENRLCAHSERGQYGKFSSNLADKFWQVVRSYYPKIDFVGIN